MEDAPLTCVSCQYIKNRYWNTAIAKIVKYPIGWQCHHPIAVVGGRVDRVTGQVIKGRPTDCDEMRMSGEKCGPEGLLWMPNDKKGLFKLIKKEST